MPCFYECNKARDSDRAVVGKTPRQQMHEAMASMGRDVTPQMEQEAYQDSVDVTRSSLEDVYTDREAGWKQNRKNNKKKIKGKEIKK
jgi:hypothetical protein